MNTNYIRSNFAVPLYVKFLTNPFVCYTHYIFVDKLIFFINTFFLFSSTGSWTCSISCGESKKNSNILICSCLNFWVILYCNHLLSLTFVELKSILNFIKMNSIILKIISISKTNLDKINYSLKLVNFDF